MHAPQSAVLVDEETEAVLRRVAGRQHVRRRHRRDHVHPAELARPQVLDPEGEVADGGVDGTGAHRCAEVGRLLEAAGRCGHVAL